LSTPFFLEPSSQYAHPPMKGPMEQSFRQEVHEFVRAAETLLSPAFRKNPLTRDESKVVEFFARSLTKQCNDLEYDES
jgi:hypothetical protein